LEKIFINHVIPDVRACVKSYAAEKSRERSEGKKIRVAIPDDVPVSAGGSYSASSDPDGGGGDLVSMSPIRFIMQKHILF